MKHDPSYAHSVADDEWDAIAERLEAFARAVWHISCRRTSDHGE